MEPFEGFGLSSGSRGLFWALLGPSNSIYDFLHSGLLIQSLNAHLYFCIWDTSLPVPRGPMVNEVQRCLMEKKAFAHTNPLYTQTPQSTCPWQREAAQPPCCWHVLLLCCYKTFNGPHFWAWSLSVMMVKKLLLAVSAGPPFPRTFHWKWYHQLCLWCGH